MKKLLLVSLLAMGATAFGATTQNVNNEATMPIHIKAIIEAPSADAIVIEDPTNLGATEILLDFGTLVSKENGTETVANAQQKVQIRKANSTAFDTKTATYAITSTGGTYNLGTEEQLVTGVKVALNLSAATQNLSGLTKGEVTVKGTMKVDGDATAQTIDNATKYAFKVTVAG